VELHEEEIGAMKIDIKIGGEWRAGGREEPSGVLMSLKTGVCCEAPHYSQNGPHTRSLHPINPSRHSGPNRGPLPTQCTSRQMLCRRFSSEDSDAERK